MRLALLPLALLLAFPGSGEAQQRRGSTPPVACADFYGHVNTAWQQANPPAPGSEGRSRFDELVQLAAAASRQTLEATAASPTNDDERALGTFWSAATNTAAMDAASTAAIAEATAPLARLRRGRDLPKVSVAFHRLGLSPLLELVVVKSTEGNAQLAAVPASLGLGDPRFYIGSDSELKTLLGRYRAYVERLLRAGGTPETELAAASEGVLQLEIALATAMANAPTARDSGSVRDLDRRHAAAGLAELLRGLDASDRDLVLLNPPYFEALAQLANQRPVEHWQALLRFRTLHTLAPWLGAPLRAAHAEFMDVTLAGQPNARNAESHAMATVQRRLGPWLDAAFLARHAPATTRDAADTLSKAIHAAAQAATAGHTDARNALAEVHWAIAPPSPTPGSLPSFGNSAAGNWRTLNRWEEQRRVGGRPLEVGEQPAHTPTLRYDPASREIRVSAAALSPPLYAGRNDAADIARLGSLMGHELSKALPAGTRGNGLVGLYNGYLAAPGQRVNGTRTLAMNKADAAGLQFAWAAFNALQPNPNIAQRKAFFTAYAELWARTDTPAAVTRQLAESPYAPAQWRVNGPLSQLRAFGETYGCRVGAVMRAAQPITVW